MYNDALATPTMTEPVAQFLRRFPPFNRIDEATIADLAGHIRIRYVEQGELIFAQGAEPPDAFYVVNKGLVALHRGDTAAGELLDLCDDGDLFGVRALLAGGPYSATAEAREDSLLYVVPWSTFKRLLEHYPQVSLFLAAGFASELPKVRDQLLAATTEARRSLSMDLEPHEDDDADVRPIDPIRSVLTCPPTSTIQQAAQKMAARRVGSIIVTDERRHPVGIMTDTDLRDKVVARAIDAAKSPIADVMTSPVTCVMEPQTVTQLVGLVMQRGLHHFCFTEDGTTNSPVVGVLSEHDLITAHGNHPTVLRQKIARTQDPDQLLKLRDKAERLVQQYLEQEASMGFICSVISGINDALIRSAITHAQSALHEEGHPAPQEGFCWLSFGSEGREEQLLRTDLDNAIVYEDPPEDRAKAVQAYYLALGTKAIEVLVHAGFSRCPGNIMASNPELNLPLSAWKSKFSKLIRAPEPMALMYASIFFDLRAVDGHDSLADELVRHILEEIAAEPMFLTFLAKNAQNNPPPLSFFRGFVLERSGDHADTFDIKARAMMPITDAARVLAYDLKINFQGSTSGRYERIAQVEPSLAQLSAEAAMAYDILMRIRAEEGFRNGNSGRYVNIKRLNKLERQSLRNTFSVVEDLQRKLASRYRTEMLR